jgi:hypothetical protein
MAGICLHGIKRMQGGFKLISLLRIRVDGMHTEVEEGGLESGIGIEKEIESLRHVSSNSNRHRARFRRRLQLQPHDHLVLEGGGKDLEER